MAERFEGDRSKFLAYLRSQGKTLRDYRRDIEENIIYQYMQGQQRKSQSVVSPVRIETFYNENKDRFYREDEVVGGGWIRESLPCEASAPLAGDPAC